MVEHGDFVGLHANLAPLRGGHFVDAFEFFLARGLMAIEELFAEAMKAFLGFAREDNGLGPESKLGGLRAARA